MKRNVHLFFLSLVFFTTSCIKDPSSERNEKDIAELKDEIKNLSKEVAELKCLINNIKLDNVVGSKRRK